MKRVTNKRPQVHLQFLDVQPTKNIYSLDLLKQDLSICLLFFAGKTGAHLEFPCHSQVDCASQIGFGREILAAIQQSGRGFASISLTGQTSAGRKLWEHVKI